LEEYVYWLSLVGFLVTLPTMRMDWVGGVTRIWVALCGFVKLAIVLLTYLRYHGHINLVIQNCGLLGINDT